MQQQQQRQGFDEMHDAAGQARPQYRAFDEWLRGTPAPHIAQKRREAEIGRASCRERV